MLILQVGTLSAHEVKYSRSLDQDSLNRKVESFIQYAKGKPAHRLMNGKYTKLLRNVPNASLSIRKKFYRFLVKDVMPNIRASWEYRRLGKYTFFNFFENDYSHFYKYLNKLEVGEIQRFFKYFNQMTSYKNHYAWVPLDIRRLKSDDARLYIIAKTQFNLLKAGRPIRKSREYY